MSCGAENEANELFGELTEGVDFAFPEIDLSGPEWNLPIDANSPLYQPITPLTIDDLTTKTLDGTGALDVIMSSVAVHLKSEYSAGRITGAEYSKTWIASMQAALSSATQFVLSKDTAKWQAITAQIQAMTAKVELQTAKANMLSKQAEANMMAANFALSKMKLATESKTYCIATYNLNNMLPAQLDLVKEQKEAQRAQTMDNRTDGTPVKGSVGAQRSLHMQQITSYQRDAELKTTKLFTDAWTVMKTMDVGLTPPNSFTNASIDNLLSKLKVNNGLN